MVFLMKAHTVQSCRGSSWPTVGLMVACSHCLNPAPSCVRCDTTWLCRAWGWWQVKKSKLWYCRACSSSWNWGDAQVVN